MSTKGSNARQLEWQSMWWVAVMPATASQLMDARGIPPRSGQRAEAAAEWKCYFSTASNPQQRHTMAVPSAHAHPTGSHNGIEERQVRDPPA